MAPTFMGALLPSAMGCIRLPYLAGISMVALKMVSGSTSMGSFTSMDLEARWQLAQAIFPVASRGSL